MNYSRRDLRLLLPILASTSSSAQPKTALPSKVFKYDDLPVHINGENKGRAVMQGDTHSSLQIEVHLTELGEGQAPHPPHKHVHEEMLLLQSGTVDVTINGQTARLVPGSVAYVASNDEHGWRNPGPGRAQYFVVALGRDV